MNWGAIGAVSELVGALAVIGTLVYLAYQIRQNTVATKGQIYQGRSSELSARSRSIAESESLSEIYSRIEPLPQKFDIAAIDVLTKQEEVRVRHTELQYLSGFDNILQQFKLGLIPEDGLEITKRGISRRLVLWDKLGLEMRGLREFQLAVEEARRDNKN